MKKMIDIWAPWCVPCKQMEPIINELEKDFTIEKVNYDENPEVADQRGVLSIPTYIIEKDGKEIKRFTGVTSKETLEEALRE